MKIPDLRRSLTSTGQLEREKLAMVVGAGDSGNAAYTKCVFSNNLLIQQAWSPSSSSHITINKSSNLLPVDDHLKTAQSKVYRDLAITGQV